MENKNDEFRQFEIKLKALMNGYISEYNDLAYIMCYLCFIDSKLENNPYNSFDKEYSNMDNNSFEAFINAIERRFKKLDCKEYKNNIEESINYLKELRFGNIDGKELIRLLKTKDLYFYEKILISNAFGKGNVNYSTRSEGTPNELIEIFKFFRTGNSVFDVGCGNGNVLVGLSYDNKQVKNVDGIEINPRNVFISNLRLSLCNGINNKIILGDYLTTSINNRYSFISINMPFGLHISSMKKNELNNYKKEYEYDWTITPAVSSEWIYANKALKLLKNGGRIILVTTQVPLFKTADIKLRKDLVDNNLIEYIIDMPAGTYPNTMINYSLVVLNNEKKDEKIRFIDASDCYVQQTINRKVDSDKLIKKIESLKGIKEIANEKVAENDYILLTTKYIGNENKSKLKNATKLSDLNVDVTRGFQLFSKNDIDENGKYSIVTISDIDENGNLNDELGRFNTDKDIEKYILKENDILISTKGTRIKTCLIKNLKRKDTIYHGNLSLIRVFDDRLDPVYLKLYLDSERGQLELKSIQTGMGIISINTSQLLKISIPLLDMSKQKEIVDDYIFRKNEIDLLSSRLTTLKNNLFENINQVFEGVKE